MKHLASIIKIFSFLNGAISLLTLWLLSDIYSYFGIGREYMSVGAVSCVIGLVYAVILYFIGQSIEEVSDYMKHQSEYMENMCETLTAIQQSVGYIDYNTKQKIKVEE